METKIPNIDSLMDGISEKESPSVNIGREQNQENAAPVVKDNTGDTLWGELMDMLNETKEKTVFTGQKIYKIDSDIVETISLCNFQGHSISHVINCILRTFLIANIRQLDGLRSHAPSLFDDYLK